MRPLAESRLAGALALVVVLGACGSRHETGRARTEPGSAKDGGSDATAEPQPVGSGSGSEAGNGGDDDSDRDEVEVPGALAPWHAVVERDHFLLRRKQQGVLVGRLGPEAIAPGARGVVRWLIDETDGNGALAVRLGITGDLPADGSRIAVRGAWALDGQRRWYWAVDSMTTLKGAGPAPSADPPAPPGLVVAVAPPPSGYKIVSRARDGSIITFGVIRSPKRPGDGWLIGDNSFSAPVAVLMLPGERDSFGGHDLRQDDERWQLKRGVLYWVRIDKVRRKPGDERTWLRAITAPVKSW